MTTNSLKAKALYFLSRRDYAYLELFNKLKKYSEDEAEIRRLLTDLASRGWLSEERYIKNYLTSKSSKYGLLKIKHTLNQKTANPKLVKQILGEAEIDEVTIAKELLMKKFPIVTNDQATRAKQIRFLQNKGFSFSIIQKVIKYIDD